MAKTQAKGTKEVRRRANKSEPVNTVSQESAGEAVSPTGSVSQGAP